MSALGRLGTRRAAPESAVVAIKICGLTRVEDATRCVALGVEALGVNVWPGSPRAVSLRAARAIARAVADRARVVLVLVDAGPAEIARARAETGIAWAQLHGDEPPEAVRAAMPCAMKAVRLATEEDVEAALGAPGLEVLLDARVEGQRGGTGVLAPFALAARVARARPTWLAGGLTPDNVAGAIAAVRPLGVDVASGVESAPGVKDPARLEAFVAAVRGASSA